MTKIYKKLNTLHVRGALHGWKEKLYGRNQSKDL